jgi:hypothetical protein
VLASSALAILLVTGLVAGCSSGTSGSVTTRPATKAPGTTDHPPPASAGPSTATVTSIATVAPNPTVPPPDAPALLTAALDAIAGGYHFVTVATVNDVVAVTAVGDRVGDGTRVDVTTGGSTVSYAITAEGTSVFSDGSWSELDQPAPAVDPVSALRTPTTVVVSSYGNGPTVLTGTYPAAALSLEGDGQVDVALEIDGTTLRTISYASIQNGTPAKVRADISPLLDATPVTLPGV